MTPVVNNLYNDEMRVRYQTMQTFIEAGDASVEALEAALEPGIEEIRWRAAATLAWVGNPKMIPAIERASIGADYALKFNCIWGLGQIGDKAAVPALLTIVQSR